MVVADRPCLQPQLRYLLDRLSRQTLALCQNAAAPEDQPLPRNGNSFSQKQFRKWIDELQEKIPGIILVLSPNMESSSIVPRIAGLSLMQTAGEGSNLHRQAWGQLSGQRHLHDSQHIKTEIWPLRCPKIHAQALPHRQPQVWYENICACFRDRPAQNICLRRRIG